MDEAVGSIPTSSTSPPEASEPWMLGGFIAGEVGFTACLQPRSFADGSPRMKFVFCVEVAQRHQRLLKLLKRHSAVGSA